MSDQHMLLLDDPWQIKPSDFAKARNQRERLTVLLNYAVLAPSILNVQPWRFRIVEDSVALFIDCSRALPVTDPSGRELTISCGSALLNLRVAARAFGYDAVVEPIPASEGTDLLARVRLAAVTPSESDQRLRDAIPARRTNRHAFDDRPLPETLLKRLHAAAANEGATLRFMESLEAKRRIAELIAEAEQIHLGNPAFRREWSEWAWQRIGEAQYRESEVRWRLGAAGHTPEPADELEVTRAMAASSARARARGEASAAEARAVAEASPVLGLLTTSSDERGAWLAAGQALQRALLLGTCAGVSASFLAPPI